MFVMFKNFLLLFIYYLLLLQKAEMIICGVIVQFILTNIS